MNYSKENAGHKKASLQACVCSAGVQNIIGKFVGAYK